MKVGDLVKHPAGMLNVNGKTYGCGIILDIRKIHLAGSPQKQVEVLWMDAPGPLVYHSTSLEVISASK